ncbi:hypothetical protein [Microcoleus sp. OTE_8_concoct_300]|uniref:hypothetical protein n=1 Tax=Microcoleus sp. OTE_8_concoct_300 TaxID=2964710 RepID=UPI00403FA7B2
MKPYQPSNKVTSTGLKWLLLSSVIGGLAIGGLTHLISLLVYLIVLFPLGMGFAGGTVMVAAIRQGKVRNPAIATLFGVITGLLLYGSLHGAGYWQFKQSASEQITKELEGVSDNQSNNIIDTFLQEKTGSKGFLGYLKHNAQQGVSIGRLESTGTNLGETGTWIYWLIELAIIDITIAAIAYSTAKNPFCENGDQWYKHPEHIGIVNLQCSENFLNLLQNDRFGEAGKLLDPLQGIHPANLEVYLQRCPCCKFSDPILTVSSISKDSNGNLKLKQVAQGVLSLSQYNKFHEAVTQNLPRSGEPNAVPTNDDEEISLAQQERSSISVGDRFESHDLSASAQAKLVEQLSRYRQVKEAYLVRKTLQYFPETPFYVLGIIRRRGFIELEEAEPNLLKKLMIELALPNQTWVICLNKDRAMTKILQQTAGQAIYRKK